MTACRRNRRSRSSAFAPPKLAPRSSICRDAFSAADVSRSRAPGQQAGLQRIPGVAAQQRGDIGVVEFRGGAGAVAQPQAAQRQRFVPAGARHAPAGLLPGDQFGVEPAEGDVLRMAGLVFVLDFAAVQQIAGVVRGVGGDVGAAGLRPRDGQMNRQRSPRREGGGRRRQRIDGGVPRGQQVRAVAESGRDAQHPQHAVAESLQIQFHLRQSVGVRRVPPLAAGQTVHDGVLPGLQMLRAEEHPLVPVDERGHVDAAWKRAAGDRGDRRGCEQSVDPPAPFNVARTASPNVARTASPAVGESRGDAAAQSPRAGITTDRKASPVGPPVGPAAKAVPADQVV